MPYGKRHRTPATVPYRLNRSLTLCRPIPVHTQINDNILHLGSLLQLGWMEARFGENNGLHKTRSNWGQPMIISASRRTDIPAFYAEWMVRRLREGYCTVPNPFNRNQVSRISLRPEDVDAIVFWTRNPRPLMPYLDELDSRGYRYYFQFTILGYPREIDPKSPACRDRRRDVP